MRFLKPWNLGWKVLESTCSIWGLGDRSRSPKTDACLPGSSALPTASAFLGSSPEPPAPGAAWETPAGLWDQPQCQSWDGCPGHRLAWAYVSL